MEVRHLVYPESAEGGRRAAALFYRRMRRCASSNLDSGKLLRIVIPMGCFAAGEATPGICLSCLSRFLTPAWAMEYVRGMNRYRTYLSALLMLVVSAGCSRNTSQTPASAGGDDRQAIESALMKYLGERGTINVSAMDVKIEDLKIAGDRADAQVLFRTKQGEGEMRMAYVLMRQSGAWTVQAPPRSETGMPHGGVAMPQGQSPTELPSGHPPVTTPAPPAKKP
jgi:hypothetical protein